jgi:hypothetical protein
MNKNLVRSGIEFDEEKNIYFETAKNGLITYQWTALKSGYIYFEITILSSLAECQIGLGPEKDSWTNVTTLGQTNSSIGYDSKTGNLYNDNFGKFH